MSSQHELLLPWIIVGGFALALLLLYGGTKFSGTAAKVLYTSSGVVASATTFYWFSQVTDAVLLSALIAAFPLVVFGLLWWRGNRQNRWMTQLAARTAGTVHRPDHWESPGFGVLPYQDKVVGPLDHQHAHYETAVEFDYLGQRILGVDYIFGSTRDDAGGSLAKATKLGNQHSIVQVRTPPVPTLLIQPRPVGERRQVGIDAMEHMLNPLDEAQLGGNMVGALRVEDRLESFSPSDSDFDRRFSVRTTDQEFARSVLTPDVMRLLSTERWLRMGQVVFQQGSLWTGRYGRLTQEVLLEGAHHLLVLARTLPAEVWHHRSPSSPEGGDPQAVRRFVNRLSTSSTNEPYRGPAGPVHDKRRILTWTAWLAFLGATLASLVAGTGFPTSYAVLLFLCLGVVPATAYAIKVPFNTRRQTAGRPQLGTRSLVIRLLLVLAVLAPGLSLSINSSLYFAGLAHDVQLTVTDVTIGREPDSSADTVELSGTYRIGDDVHTLTDSTWMSTNAHPREGDVADVSIGPIWWNPMLETTGVAVVLFLMGLGLVLVSLFGAKLLFNLAPKSSDSGQPSGVKKTRDHGDASGADSPDHSSRHDA